MKKLPISISNAMIVSECWTFTRLAIIQTSPYAQDWIASHMRIFADFSGDIHFGENLRRYLPSYYSDILEQNHINIFEIANENLILTIKRKIDSNQYVIISSLSHNIENNPVFHEIMIYGYDDSLEVFLSSKIQNRVFIESTVPYKELQDNFPLVKKHWGSSVENYLAHTINYFPPFLSCSLKSSYDVSNCLYMAMQKIDAEIYGAQLISSVLSDNMSIYDMNTYYTGIACLASLSKTLTNLCQDISLPSFIRGLSNIIKKLHENRTLILLAMKYIVSKINITPKDDLHCIEAYEKCCERVWQWCNMALKYELTNDKLLLFRINCQIAPAFLEERNVLKEFRTMYIDAYERAFK